MIRSIIVLAALIFSQSAFAFTQPQEVGFQISPFVGNNGRVYYNCESVRGEAKKVLTMMGASDIRVSCSGGIDPIGNFPPTPNVVRASFLAPSQGEFETIQFQGRDNCHLVTELFNGVRDAFIHHNVQGLKACRSAGASYNFSVEVLK